MSPEEIAEKYLEEHMQRELPDVKVRFRVAWWVPVYVNGLKFFCVLCGTQPDYDKAARTVLKGVYFRSLEFKGRKLI